MADEIITPGAADQLNPNKQRAANTIAWVIGTAITLVVIFAVVWAAGKGWKLGTK